MTIEYQIEFSVDMGSVVAPVGEMLTSLNNHLATAGCHEKLSVRGKLFSMTLKIDHELTDDEKNQVKTIVQKQFDEHQPAWKAKVESIRRKSGNVEQSAA